PVHAAATSQTPADTLQVVPLERRLSAGQLPVVPLQFSATSQPPADARQMTLLASNVSGGQSDDAPQFSAESQTPVDARHTAVLMASIGHAALVQLPCSAMSQTPAGPRLVVLLEW